MDFDSLLPHSKPIIANSAHVRNVVGGYYDCSTTVTKNKTVHVCSPGRQGIDRLLDHVAHGALHDSAERGPNAPKCHPETRVAVQRNIMGWIGYSQHEDTPKKILWLSGPAGSGKTAIAGTIADECYKEGLLAASFFFSAFDGSINRRWKKPLIPTLVYRLVQHESIDGLREEVLAVIDRDPGVFERHLDQQAEELILKPLRKVAGRSDRQRWPKVIIIDGLDECEGDGKSLAGADAQREILFALSRVSSDPAFPFRIIVASRPEAAIRHSFSAFPGCILNIFLDDKYDPDSDIRLFLRARFSDIRRRFNLLSTWASNDVVDLFVAEASGQFIYAATIIRFLDNHSEASPQKQLSRLLEWRNLDRSGPFVPLDALYSRILHTSPRPLLAAKYFLFIRDHATTRHGLSPALSQYASGLLGLYPGEIEYVLGSLPSLVRLADEQGTPAFHLYHKSLLDFLEDPHRSADLHISGEDLANFAGDVYYQIMRRRIPPSPLPNDFLDIFCNWLPEFIEPHRRYSSLDVKWWLANSSQSTEIGDMFASIHRECKWYHCLPACSVWRKAILQHCSERGWRVPTPKEMLRDRFKKYEYSEDRTGDYPLRAARQEVNNKV